MRAAPAILGAVLLTGCTSSPGEGPHSRPLFEGKSISVKILDQWFVFAEERRMPREELLYRLRQQVRKLRAAGEPAPDVILSLPPAPVPDGLQRLVRGFIQQLQLAGIRGVRVGA